MKGFLILLAMLGGVHAWGQQANAVVFTVQTGNGKPLEGATIEILHTADSDLAKIAVTDKLGNAQVTTLAAGSYLARASMVHYHQAYSAAFTIEPGKPAPALPVMVLQPQSQLSTVTVTARKPFVQRLNDRLVVNVEGSLVNAGSTALEVLERSPGVAVDQNDNISLSGRNGVIVMIDGKVSVMQGADLANYLKSLPASAIERIDIITNPSAKYEAAGNSGIIDIRLKKDQRMGTNGTVNMGYSQGIYPKATAGTSFNYRNRNLNVFGNYSYNYRQNFNQLNLDRNFYTNGILTAADLKDNRANFAINTHTGRLGADYNLSKNTVMGVVVNGSFNDADVVNRNYARVLDASRKPAFSFSAISDIADRFSNAVGNINIKHTFDTAGRELTADFDRGRFSTNNLSLLTTKYFTNNGQSQRSDYRLSGDQQGTINITSFKTDYVHPLKNGLKAEAGFKRSLVATDNAQEFIDKSNPVPEVDTTKTNHFLYNEYNTAGYLNLQKQFKKWNVQVGLRGEHTQLNTLQKQGNIAYDSSYFKLFPSAFVNYKLSEDKTLSLSVSRRIDRPDYQRLNPFIFLIDLTTYGSGNPGLRPQFTWSYEAGFNYKQINTNLVYSHTTDNQTSVIIPFKDAFPGKPVADSNVTVQVPLNLNTSEYIGFTFSAPLRIANWWNTTNNLNVYYQRFTGNLANTPLNNGQPAGQLSSNSNFTLKKGWSAELNFTYNSKARYSYMIANPRWGLSAGVQKQVIKNKGTIRLNVTDIFFTNLPGGTITYNSYQEFWKAQRDSRVANLTFTYRFGNSKVAGARKRTTASEEERRRAGAN